MSGRHHAAEVIGERTLHIADSSALSKEIAAYLLVTNQTAQLDSIIRDVMAYRAERGIIEITATSAHDLSSKDLQDIKTILKKEYPSAVNFNVDKAQDPEVIGGVRLDMPGEQLDLTVRSKVNTFKRLTTAGEEV